MLPVMIFALIHGTKIYGAHGIAVFVGICLVVGDIFENVGVRTGFPYGRYFFTERMGPKLFAVPVMLALAYVGMAYLAWTLATLIVGTRRGALRGWLAVIVPVVASFIMVAWDFSMDPIWSTLVGAWTWVDGGPYFGCR